MWVFGSELHYLDPNGSDYAETGAAIDTPAGAVPGSIWMQADGNVQYIDASGVRRQISKTPANPGYAPPAALVGSIFVEPGNTAGLRVVAVDGLGAGRAFTWWNGF